LRKKGRPPSMEGNYEYIVEVAVDERQGVVFQLEARTWG
jgi:hypothetical protein